jgi:thiol-disulfide isomerase/thioredoxin
MPGKRIFVLLIMVGCCLAGGPLYAVDDNNEASAMRPISYQQWLQQRETYRGHILVVDMWATWCTSCIERFPKMVSLHNKYADRGVQIVSMNLDDHGDTQAIAAANRFLRSVGARFPNYHMDENLMQAFEKLDLIGIPVVAIYDKRGEQRYRLTGDNPYKQFTDRDIETAIQHLLNE